MSLLIMKTGEVCQATLFVLIACYLLFAVIEMLRLKLEEKVVYLWKQSLIANLKPLSNYWFKTEINIKLNWKLSYYKNCWFYLKKVPNKKPFFLLLTFNFGRMSN